MKHLLAGIVPAALLAAWLPLPGEGLAQLVQSGRLSDLGRPGFSDVQQAVRRFYAPDYQLAWIRDGVLSAQAIAAAGLLQNAALKGLNPEDYDASLWSARVTRLRSGNATAEEQARFDLGLTVSMLRYASDLHPGRANPRTYHGRFDGPELDSAVWLRSSFLPAADLQAAVREIEPPFEEYRRTEAALARYIELAQMDTGAALPPASSPVRPGTAYSGAPRLAELLRELGDLPADAAAPAAGVYGGPVVEAVKRFQARHGLDADGVLGPATLRELNTPLRVRTRQLALALERWRWIPHNVAPLLIVVNLPEFRLRALGSFDRVALEMKVVAGKAYGHQTPVFASQITSIIFRPSWNVPLSIQLHEMVPLLQRDRGYLARNGFETVDQDGHASMGPVTDETLAQLKSGRLQIRQLPGPRDALGLIKFVIPNASNVYLHDTPEQGLFARSRRDFSHGCIRVEHPVDLAAWSLHDLPGWTRERIKERMQAAGTSQVELPQPIPILIVYITARVSENGEVRFFGDIYGLDDVLERALAERWATAS